MISLVSLSWSSSGAPLIFCENTYKT